MCCNDACLQYYCGVVTNVRAGSGTCDVTFPDYGNTEQVPLTELQPLAGPQCNWVSYKCRPLVGTFVQLTRHVGPSACLWGLLKCYVKLFCENVIPLHPLTLPKCCLLCEVDYETMPSFVIFSCSLAGNTPPSNAINVGGWYTFITAPYTPSGSPHCITQYLKLGDFVTHPSCFLLIQLYTVITVVMSRPLLCILGILILLYVLTCGLHELPLEESVWAQSKPWRGWMMEPTFLY